MADRDEIIAFFSGARSKGVSTIITRPVGRDLSQMIIDHDLDYDITGVVMCSMLLACAEIPNTTVMRQSDEPEFPSVRTRHFGEARDAAQHLSSSVDGVLETDRRGFLQQFLTLGDSGRAWLRDLVACHQISVLTAENVQNYFLSQGGTRVRGGPIVRLLDAAVNMMPKLVEMPEVREEFSDVTFIKYHVNYSSTPGLVERFIDDTSGFTEISEETKAIVDNAADMYWDRKASEAIPVRIVAMTRAYLEAAGTLPNNWYQGIKAMNATAPAIYNKWVKTFRRYLIIVQQVEGIDTTVNVDELKRLVGRDTVST